jgi:hypothetical protein
VSATPRIVSFFQADRYRSASLKPEQADFCQAVMARRLPLSRPTVQAFTRVA